MKPARGSTANEILDVAEALTQTRGFNGFSYADISQSVGVTKASLHYHFKTKADLGRRLIERYSENFGLALATIDQSGAPARAKLEQYARLYSGVLAGERMCLCGMLAAEVTTLPEPMRDEIQRFFDLNERWLARTFSEGREAGSLRFEGSPLEAARLLLGTLEGAMLVARSYGDASRFGRTADLLLAELGG